MAAWNTLTTPSEPRDIWSDQSFDRLTKIISKSSVEELNTILDRLEAEQTITPRERDYILRARQWILGNFYNNDDANAAYMAHVEWCIRETVRDSTSREFDFLKWLDAWVEAQSNGPMKGWHI